MLKSFILILILGAIHFSPNLQKANFSAFEYKYESKTKLKELGFIQDSIKSFDNKIFANDNRYKRKINDTIIEFNFNDNILISKKIILQINLIDTSLLFSRLHQNGFERLPAAGNFGKYDFYNSKIKERYGVFINSRFIVFLNEYGINKTKIPNQDSVSAVNKR